MVEPTSSGLKLNGFGPFAEAVRDEVNGIRADWRLAKSELQADVARSLLELERVGAMMRERLAALCDGADGADGAPGRDGADGAPGRDGERGERGEKGDKGDPGERGDKGDRGDPGERGERGERGEAGPPGTFAAPRKFAAGVIFYGGDLAYHEGSTFVALRDTVATPPHADWQPVAWRGSNGYPGSARGLYDPQAAYRALDVVTLNGSEWRAVRDDPGALPGDGWVLGAKGAKGKPGDKGDKGDPGRPGADAPRVDQIICGADFSIVLMMTDGTAIACDLTPILERYREATAA